MKYIYILFTFLFVVKLNAQTDSIEKAILYQQFLDKKLTAKKFSELGKEWNDAKETVGYYPELPRDPSGLVHFSVLFELNEFSKEFIFNRTLEWLSITYELYPQYLHSNFETGKIIFTNSYNIDNTYSCVYTAIITIKENKLLYEILNIKYEGFHAGYWYNSTWIPDFYETLIIEKMYPIILNTSSKWKQYLDLLKSIKSLFESDKKNLYNYISQYNNLNKF